MTRSAEHALAVALLSLLSFAASACSSSSDLGPRSRDALRKAEPLQFGCAYVTVEYSSYGTSSSTTKTPQCKQGYRCDQLNRTPDSYTDYAGDNAFHSGKYVTEEVNFTG